MKKVKIHNLIVGEKPVLLCTVLEEDVESTILETIARRPCTIADLSKILGLHTKEINKYIRNLKDNNMISVVNQKRGSFYQIQK